MGKKLYKNNPGLRFLINFWSRYCQLEDWHLEWIQSHIQILSSCKKGDSLYLEGQAHKHFYLVGKGLIARVQTGIDSDKRIILSMAVPGMALMTTDHLYSHTPSKGDIVVLRSDSIIIQIPYKAFRHFKEKEGSVDTLADVLSNKKRKQVMTLRRIMLESDAFKRYFLFCKEMPQIETILTQVEQADLLCISRKTIQRAQYFLLKGERPQN